MCLIASVNLCGTSSGALCVVPPTHQWSGPIHMNDGLTCVTRAFICLNSCDRFILHEGCEEVTAGEERYSHLDIWGESISFV